VIRLKCSYCGDELDILPFTCKYCGEKFCIRHQLPENHECIGLIEWKFGKLKKFKKPIGPKKNFGILHFDFIKRKRKRKDALKIIVFLIALILIVYLVKKYLGI